MGWPGSIGVGVLTAATATLLAGWVANLAVTWYRISSFEGKSGYFIVGMALLGLIGGLLIGIVTSRLLGDAASHGFLKSLGLAQLLTLGAITAIGGVARLLADVPPRLGGQPLLLAVEFRWRAAERPPEPAAGVEWSVRLGSSVRRRMRASETGPLWREDARLEDGYWVVPGAVELFTQRGERTVDLLPEGVHDRGYLVPLPARPGRTHLEWSGWLPRAREGEPALAEGVQYRFRVVPRNQPIRFERVGPFTVGTIAQSFGREISGEQPRWYATARFTISYQGQPIGFEEREEDSGTVTSATEVDVVAELPGTEPALLVQVHADREGARCHLVVAGAAGPRVTTIERCGNPRFATPLTDDAARYHAALHRPPALGRVDRTTFAMPGPYHLDGAILDTRVPRVRHYRTEGLHRLISRIPPLGLSPDGDSFIRLEFGDDTDDPLHLAVTHLSTGERYRLPIDPTRMRYMDMDQIDPAWVMHHFAWQRDGSGADRLAERPEFVPLPWRGSLTFDATDYREYRVGPALAGLRTALIDFLVSEFDASRLDGDDDAFARRVLIGGDTVSVSYREQDAHVGVWKDRGTDMRLVTTIAERFDAALATGRYDHLLGIRR